MLDAEARMLLDLMEKAVQDGRPKLHTLPYAVGRQAVDIRGLIILRSHATQVRRSQVVDQHDEIVQRRFRRVE